MISFNNEQFNILHEGKISVLLPHHFCLKSLMTNNLDNDLDMYCNKPLVIMVNNFRLPRVNSICFRL